MRNPVDVFFFFENAAQLALEREKDPLSGVKV
jgi:hypothetical protein